MPSGGFPFRRVGELIDAALVTPAEEVVREKSADAGLGHLDSNQPGAEGDGVAIVVVPGKRRGQRLRDLRTAAGGIAVGGDGDADARPANSDSTLGPAICQSFGEEGPKAGVIDAFSTVGAKVDDLMAVGPKPVGKLVLHFEAGVIGGQGNAHARFLARKLKKRHRRGR